MRRLATLLALSLMLPACASLGGGVETTPSARFDGMELNQAAARAPYAQDAGGTGDADVQRPGKSTGGARAGEWLWKGPLNLVWWPWKIVGKAGRGLVDGVGAGFDEGRVPILGLAMSPVNAAVGLVSGTVEGIGMGPGLITPETDAGKAFAKPTSVPTTIWWY